MNTNNVYYAKIYRLINIEEYGSGFLDLSKDFISKFSRYTLVFQKSNGKFYDLYSKMNLKCEFDFFTAKVGEEKIDAKSLIPFNSLVHQDKDNLSKREIKNLYYAYQQSALEEEESNKQLKRTK